MNFGVEGSPHIDPKSIKLGPKAHWIDVEGVYAQNRISVIVFEKPCILYGRCVLFKKTLAFCLGAVNMRCAALQRFGYLFSTCSPLCSVLAILGFWVAQKLASRSLLLVEVNTVLKHFRVS